MASTRKKVNGVWVDVPDRPTTVSQDIRRLNGGKLASELGTPTTTTRDKRFQNRWDFAWDRLYAPKFGASVRAAVQAEEDGLTTVTYTNGGYTGVNISQEYSPMAVRPGTRRSSNVFDVVRAGIAEKAADKVRDDWTRHSGKNDAIDTQDPGAVKKATSELNSQFNDAKEELAKGFVDNFAKSIKENIDKSWTPRDTSKMGERSEAATTAREAYETARESGDVQRTREAFQNWRSAVNGNEPRVSRPLTKDNGDGTFEDKTITVSKSTDDLLKKSEETRNSAQSVLDEFNRRFGVQATAKGGSANRSPVSGSDDRFLDDLIGELEA